MRNLLVLGFLNLLLSSCISNKPYITDASTMSTNKNRIIEGHRNLSRAKSQLIEEADFILEKRQLYSVTFKTVLPPSSSKNDFYSLAPYWWPDSSKENGLPYIRKDGQMNPERDQIQDGRMLVDVSSDIYKLGIAFYYTQDSRYVEWINELVRVFFIDPSTKMNPNFNYAQLIKGREGQSSTTIGAISFIQLIEGVQLAKDSPAFNKRQLRELKGWFEDLVVWMENDEKPIKDGNAQNNIGVYYTAQTVVYHLFVGNVQQARRILETNGKRIVDQQIDKDGKLNAELKRAAPWGYVKYAFTAFDYLIQLSNKLNVDLYEYENSQGGSIEKMFNWILQYATGAKEWEYSRENVTPREVKTILIRSRAFNNHGFLPEGTTGLESTNILTNNVF